MKVLFRSKTERGFSSRTVFGTEGCVFCSFSRSHEIIVIGLGATQTIHPNNIFKRHARHVTSSNAVAHNAAQPLVSGHQYGATSA